MRSRVLFSCMATVLSFIPTSFAYADWSCSSLLETASNFRAHDHFRSIESFWKDQFNKRGWNFEPAHLEVPVKAHFETCYFPDDRTLFIPEGRPDNLILRMAHEYGHHVQELLGINQYIYQIVQRMKGMNPLNPMAGSDLFMVSELQADCLAGVYFSYLWRNRLLSEVRIKEQIDHSFIVDSKLTQSDEVRQNSLVRQGYSHPDHAIRKEWFERGMASGDTRSCEPFGGLRFFN